MNILILLLHRNSIATSKKYFYHRNKELQLTFFKSRRAIRFWGSAYKVVDEGNDDNGCSNNNESRLSFEGATSLTWWWLWKVVPAAGIWNACVKELIFNKEIKMILIRRFDDMCTVIRIFAVDGVGVIEEKSEKYSSNMYSRVDEDDSSIL